MLSPPALLSAVLALLDDKTIDLGVSSEVIDPNPVETRLSNGGAGVAMGAVSRNSEVSRLSVLFRVRRRLDFPVAHAIMPVIPNITPKKQAKKAKG
jgi:hypothetical protein